MAQRSRSFTEYVKHHLDNQLWNALEEYLSNLDSSALQLRLRSISNVGEFELYDTEIQFVNVSNLPGSNIAFDVVLDATLIVYDADRYHNDKSEAIHQWFVLKCEGDLSCNLNNMTINDIEIYYAKSKSSQPMSDSLVPIIHKGELEKTATDFLDKYFPEALSKPMYLDPTELTKRMNLNVKQAKIAKDLSVFGQIYFRDTQATVYDAKSDSDINIPVKRGTIIVDPEVAFQRNLGAFNNTIVHECVHWELHKKAFDLERLFNENASQIKCKVVGGVEGAGNEATKWMEWQANALAPRIQMPLEMFKRQASATIKKYRDKLGIFELCELMPFVIEELAQFFMVSKTAAKIRMIDAGYEEAMGSFIYIDGHYVKPHAFKKGSIKPNQTYSIPAKDAAILCLTNKKLRNAEKYIYIDSHFVLDHPKYIEKNADGKTQMTDYARYHIDECCLAFQLTIKDKIDEHYHTECFLNRDKSSPLNFEIVFTGENEELDDEQRKQLLHDTVMEEAKVLDSLSNNYTQAWKQVLKWRGISQAELARRTSISEKTIGNIINATTIGSINNIVLMCLAAHLPWDISEYMIKHSGTQLLLTNEDHVLYRFALKHMNAKSIEEVQEFLRDQGAKTL